MDKAQQDAMKKEAGIEAAKLITDGMIAGLGTGSTVRFLVDELGRRVQEEGLDFTGVTTSRRTQEQAEGYGIKIVNIDDVDHIDLTIDGADEVDANFNGIKGGGAALLWEKIVAVNSNKIVWIVDESKVVDVIGKFPLPVEVIPFGWSHVFKRLDERGYKPVLRLDAEGKPVRTDENNYVIDLHLERIDDPQALAQDLINIVGVVEHGLFLNMVNEVIVGSPDGPRVLTNPNKGAGPGTDRRRHRTQEAPKSLGASCHIRLHQLVKTTCAGGESYAAVCGASSCSSACGAS